MIPRNTSKSIRTHKNIRSMRSVFTKAGPAQGHWSRVRETELLARRQRPAVVRHAPHH